MPCSPRREGASARRLVLLLAVPLAAGCAHAPADRFGTGPSRDPVLLSVENHCYENVELILLRSGAPERIGRVGGLASRLLRIDGDLFATVPDVRIVVRFRHGEQWESGPVLLDAGSRVRLIVEQTLVLSSLVAERE